MEQITVKCRGEVSFTVIKSSENEVYLQCVANRGEPYISTSMFLSNSEASAIAKALSSAVLIPMKGEEAYEEAERRADELTGH